MQAVISYINISLEAYWPSIHKFHLFPSEERNDPLKNINSYVFQSRSRMPDSFYISVTIQLLIGNIVNAIYRE